MRFQTRSFSTLNVATSLYLAILTDLRHFREKSITGLPSSHNTESCAKGPKLIAQAEILQYPYFSVKSTHLLHGEQPCQLFYFTIFYQLFGLTDRYVEKIPHVAECFKLQQSYHVFSLFNARG